MTFYDEVVDALLGEQTLDRLRESLVGIGVDAEVYARGRPEETFIGKWPFRSLGIVSVFSGPISWVNVLRRSHEGGTGYLLQYGVRDKRDLPAVHIETVRVKAFPVFGQVVDVRWDGDDSGLGVADRLKGDGSISHCVANKNWNFTIQTPSRRRCWVVSERKVVRRVDFGADKWECVRAIARILLDTDWPVEAEA